MDRHARGAGAPSALSHGLTSRWAMEALEEEVEALAPRLLGASPPSDTIMRAARKAAEAILRVNRVRAIKTYALNRAEHPRRKSAHPFVGMAEYFRADVCKLFAAEISQGVSHMPAVRRDTAAAPKDAGSFADAMLKFLGENDALLGRLEDYERRALSVRTKAIRELDCARIEAERQAAHTG